MKKVYLILFFSILILFFSNLNAQSKLEKDFSKSVFELKIKNEQLDSLNNILAQKLNQINKEKSKQEPDNEIIEKLLSSTSNITNKIEKYELEKNRQLVNHNKLRKDLGAYYNHQIDSLKKDSEEKNFLEIIELTERRFLIAEEIDQLSFNPEKIEKLKPVNDSTKRIIYFEFLSSIKNEVENKISEMNFLKSEIENIIKLNKEKEEFLEEIAFNSRTLKSTSKNFSATAESSFDSENTPSRDVVNNYSKSINGILNQLEFNKIADNKLLSTRNLANNFNYSTNMKDLLKLISKAEKELSDYKIVINNKIKNL